MCFLATWISSLVKRLFKLSAPFLTDLLFLYWAAWAISIYWILIICKYFLPFCGLSFYLMISFAMQKLLSLIRFYLFSCFSFHYSRLLLFSHSVVFWLFATPWMQHTRLPCPSPTPGACSNSSPLNWWCHPTILSSVFLFCFCLQSFPPSWSFPLSQLFTSGGQIIGA